MAYRSPASPHQLGRKKSLAEAEREVVQIAAQLEAEVRRNETWVEETRARARSWVMQVARGDPGLTSLVNSRDPNGAAPGLSVRARDAIAEMLLNWVSVATNKAAWSGSEEDLSALRAEVVRGTVRRATRRKGSIRRPTASGADDACVGTRARPR